MRFESLIITHIVYLRAHSRREYMFIEKQYKAISKIPKGLYVKIAR